MKTLFLYTVEFYMFCSCTCVFGIIQPHPIDSSSKLSYVQNGIQKCKEVTVDVRKNHYLSTDNLLCFGVNVLSQRFRGVLEENLDDAAVEKKYEEDICEHFHEMKLNSTQDKLNESAVYNRQFENKSTCEKACLDVFKNVNPLCKVILLLNYYSKGSPIVRGTPAPSTILSGGNVDNDNNEVPDQSRTVVNDVPNISTDGQKMRHSYVAQANFDQKAASITQGETAERLKTHEGAKSAMQDTENVSQGTKSPSTGHVGTIQQIDVNEVSPVKGNPEPANEEMTSFPDISKGQLSTNALPVEKGNIIPGNNTVKETTESKKESKVTNVKNTSLVVDSKSVAKSDSLLQPSVVLPSNSDDAKNEQVTAISSKTQEKVDTVKDGLTSKKIVTNTGLKGDDSISQVSNVEEDRGIVNSEKPQAGNKETENISQKKVDLQINLKTTKETPKSNTNKQRINQKNENAETAQDAEPAPQSGKSDTGKTIGDGESFTSDTGDDIGEPDLHLSGDAGELNDNTEIYSGGGTGVDSDVFESGGNIISNDRAVAIPMRDKDDDDDDSHFFAYFMTTMVFCIVGYLLFHNKQKILALALEGRARRGRRRPNTSGYRKLDSNLEEAISSSKSASVTQVIY